MTWAQGLMSKAGSGMMNGVAVEKMGAGEVGPPARLGRGQMQDGTAGKMKGLLGDEAFMSALMGGKSQGGGGGAYQRGFQGEATGLGSYHDMMQKGFEAEHAMNPMMGLGILNQMQYRPQQRHPFQPQWHYVPRIRR